MSQMRALFVTLFLAISLSPSSFGQDKTVRLANGEWPPYTSKKLVNFGVLTHIVTRAFEMSGLDPEYTFLPWKRAYYETKVGKYDATLAWAPTEKRKKDLDFSSPVVHIKKSFFYLKSLDFKWEKFEDLKKHKISKTDGYTYGDEFDALDKKDGYQIFTVNTDLQRLHMLISKRHDLMPIDRMAGYYLLKNNFDKKTQALVTHDKRVLMDTPICIAFSKEIPKKRREFLMKSFEIGLAKFKKSNEYKILMKSMQN